MNIFSQTLETVGAGDDRARRARLQMFQRLEKGKEENRHEKHKRVRKEDRYIVAAIRDRGAEKTE